MRVRNQPHMQFVTHKELDDLIQGISDVANEALRQAGQKTGRMDLLSRQVSVMQDASNGLANRISQDEDRISALEVRMSSVEDTLADQQQQIDALALLFS